MDPSPHWNSSPFRGGGGRHNARGGGGTPRFRGDGGGGGGFGTPRGGGYSPQWQQRSPSPYHQYQHRFQQGGGSPFNQHRNRSPYDPQFFATSTPLHGSGGGRRPFFRGGGGGRGRFNQRPSFDRNNAGDNIENWISPEMWSDPWRHLIPTTTTNTKVPVDETGSLESEHCTSTKFADSDFNVSDSLEVQTKSESSEDQQQDLPVENPVGLQLT